jgi:acyl carrier protein
MTIHTLQSIEASITEIVKTELQWTEGLPKGDFAKQLDSIQRLSLVVAIEDEFEICFSPEDDSSIQTLNDLSQAILRLLEEE